MTTESLISSIDWSLAANLATAFTLILAIIVFGWQVIENWKQRRYNRSAFNMDAAIRAYEEAIAMLADGNNDRVIWNSAARVLARAEVIASRITHKAHQDVFQAKLEKYRKELGDILGYRNPQRTGSFFYGAVDPATPIEHAAMGSIQEQEYGNWGTSILRRIDESALWCVWKAAQFPADYADPLEGQFPDEVISRGPMRTMWPGLNEYLKHRREFVVDGGRVVQRGAERKR